MKIVLLLVTITLTVAIHYGWVLEALFGHAAWVHAVHSRFCYIPIAIAAAWFGLRGGLTAAAAISLLVVPYLLGGSSHEINLSMELVEIVFYFAIGALIGALIDRDRLIRKKQEETARQLERSHHLSLVGQMAAGVAHEVKNPLASIKGAVEILSDDTTAQKDKSEFREIVVREIERIDGTVKEFLEFARPKETKLERLDLSQSLTASLRQLESQLSKSGVRLETEIDNGVEINGDKEKLHQVILNLVLNAIEASPANSTLNVTLRKSGDNAALLTVRDEGKGIEHLALQKVFEPFYTTKSSGVGLGLAIVKAIIEDHGGTIAISSEQGKGTEICLTFPLLKGQR